MSQIRRSLVSIIALVLASALPLFAGTATELAPQSAPTGARFVVAGSGLDAGTLVISFASASGPLSAQIVSRTATLVEGIVPAAATSGSVQVTQGGAAIASFGFTVTPPPGYGHVATLAASDKAHDVLKSPAGVAVIASTGAVIVADTAHHRIVSVSGTGVVSLLAGSGKPGQTDGAGAAAQFKSPSGVVVDQQRSVIYVADTGNNVIRRVTFDGIVSTLAGSGRPEDADGTGAQAGFKAPMGVAVDLSGNVYVADTGNSKIKIVSPTGVVHTIAGGTHEGLGDGPALQALFKQPQGVAVSSTGVVFVGDTANNVIRKLENGVVTTIAGTGHGGYANGSGAISEFKQPSGITLDDGGNVYVADTQNNAIRRITIAGTTVTVSTLAGGGKAGLLDGDPATAKFSGASGVVFAGVIYVADTGNDALRAIVPALDATAVYPHGGPTAGGNVARLFGTGFLPGPTQVAFGAIQATNITFVSSTELLATAPAGSGTVDVKVTAASGSDTLSAAYTYLPPPTISSVQPAKGATAGGTSLTINGTAFMTGQTTVTLGGVAAAVTVVNSGSLTVATPANAAGPADVVVTTPGGSATLPHAFTYFAPPVITNFAPSQGAAGAVVTITGQNFDPDATGDQVLFGSLPATIQSASPTQLIVTAPAGVTSGRISVTTAGGTATSATDFSTAAVVSLEISTPTTSFQQSSTVPFNAVARMSNGSGIDVSQQAGWSSSNGNVASVGTTGLVSGLTAGNAVVTATFGGFSATSPVTIQPLTFPVVAPSAIDRTVVQPLADTIRFLYSGAGAVQTGVTANAIDDERVSTVRGTLRDRNSQPIPGVTVTVAGHPELGQTLTRAGGVFDIALNGGGAVTLRFDKPGYIEAQRLVASQWNDQKVIDDVVLVGYDAHVTAVAMGAAQPQVVQGSAVQDNDGRRTATVILPAGEGASIVAADGRSVPASVLHIRATEFTVGSTGPQAMPAPLPATSGYTYCVELSADEAVTGSVHFTKPVSIYVENFVGFPVGAIVPVGYYDRNTNAWKASANGRVIKILSIANGLAVLDTNGDGVADDATTLSALGIDDAERKILVSTYAVGQTVWRMTMDHFTPCDGNWPVRFPSDATHPSTPSPSKHSTPNAHSAHKQCGWSVVDCANQVLSETVPIQGTPYSLDYSSSSSSLLQYQTTVHLSGPTVPASVRRIELRIDIAGTEQILSFPPQLGLEYTFVWNGLDAFGRRVQGTRIATFTTSYIYLGGYELPTDSVAWSATGPAGGPDSRELGLQGVSSSIALGHIEGAANFGGWTFSGQRFYDGIGRTIYEAGGNQRAADPQGTHETASMTIAGSGNDCCFSPDGTPAASASLSLDAVAPAPDGSFYVIDNNRVRRVGRDGLLTTVAGTDQFGFTPDGALALGNPMYPTGLAVGPDGTLYVIDDFSTRVRAIVSGHWVTVAGNGTSSSERPGIDINGVSATSVGITASGIAVGPDGALYISGSGRIYRVDPDRLIHTIAGGPVTNSGQIVDGAPSSSVSPFAWGLAVGPDGSVYYADPYVYSNEAAIGRITPDGRVYRVAGSYTAPNALLNGQSATSGKIQPYAVAAAADGTLLVGDVGGHHIWSIAQDGTATIFAGNGQVTRGVLPANGLFSRSAEIEQPWNVAIAADGSAVYLDVSKNIVRRADASFPKARTAATVIPTPDGSAAYVFEASRETRTFDTLTGVTLETFAYDAAGNLTSITDPNGLVTTIERGANGDPTAIVAPNGQRTALAIDNGLLTSVTDPAGATCGLGYDQNGLLTRFIDRRGGLHQFSYDANGLLLQDSDPVGGFIALSQSGTGSVTRTSAEGRTQSYASAVDATGQETYTHIDTAGLATVRSFYSASTSISASDGTSASATFTPDSRFGMLSPVDSMTLTSGSKTLNLTRTRSVTLSDPQNVLSLTSLTEAVTLNGSTWTTRYDAATRRFTTQSPAGRQSFATLDDKGRVVLVQAPSFADVTTSYDARGRTSSVTQGSRTATFTYDALDRLQSVTDPLHRTTSFTYDPANRVVSQTLPDGRVIGFTYDAAGNLTSVTPPSRPVHSFTFTAIDLTASYTPPTVPGTGSDAIHVRQGSRPHARHAVGREGHLARLRWRRTVRDDHYAF